MEKTNTRNVAPDRAAEEVPGYMRRLRRLRTNAGLTQQQVASHIGSSRSNYIRYERGRSDMPVRHLITLCDLYDVSADHVLGLDTSRASVDVPPAQDAVQKLAADRRRHISNLDK